MSARKLRFKIWDCSRKKWVKNWSEEAGPVPLVFLPEVCGDEGDFYFDFFDSWNGFPYKILQSTDLKDEDEREIYEGDIVSVIEHDYLFEVCFGKIYRTVKVADNVDYFVDVEINCFYFRHIKSGNPCFNLYNNKFGEHDLSRTKIVGNIFENPELLQKI